MTGRQKNVLEPVGTRWVDETLFMSEGGNGALEEGTALRGAQCPACATATFPAQTGCPNCGKQGMTDLALPRNGTLWSFTIQNFQPKAPYRLSGEFAPYGVGYIDLGSVIVESRLIESRPEELRIGETMHLCFVTAFFDEEGVEVRTFAFGREEA